ncbi:MAG: hypothetical protein HY537_13540 [Deltaproteobacteria bacterium]|nr:hypothetical protein [Deltaproteobacteria bacterium]
MTKLILGILLLVMGSVYATEIPTYLGSVKGAAITSIVDRQAFNFTSGEISNCERKEVVDWVTFKCDVRNADLTVAPTRPSPLKATFEKVYIVFVWDREAKDLRREYYFSGRMKEAFEGLDRPLELSSDVRLVLWYHEKLSQRIRGSVELKDFGVSAAIEALQQR